MHVAHINDQSPIFKYEIRNRKIVLMIIPYKVPFKDSFAFFIACNVLDIGD